jgi:hypothetical protein
VFADGAAHEEIPSRMIAAAIAGSVLKAKWPCPSSTRMRALGTAAAARCVNLESAGSVSEPVSKRVLCWFDRLIGIVLEKFGTVDQGPHTVLAAEIPMHRLVAVLS